MKNSLQLRFAAACLIALAVTSLLPAQQTPYPDNEKGLKELVSAMLKAAKRNDETAFGGLATALKLPDSNAWFRDVFGEELGKEIDRSYVGISDRLGAVLFPGFVAMNRDGFKEIEILRMEVPCVPGINLDQLRLLSARQQAVPLYSVRAKKSGAARSVGFFAFAGDAFRFVGNVRFPMPPEPPENAPRPVPAGKVDGKNERPAPLRYPPGAKKERITGTVVMRAVIGEDGLARRLHYVSGPCLLAEAAMTEASRWKYKPTLLNGKPIEVVTIIEVVFNLTP